MATIVRSRFGSWLWQINQGMVRVGQLKLLVMVRESTWLFIIIIFNIHSSCYLIILFTHSPFSLLILPPFLPPPPALPALTSQCLNKYPLGLHSHLTK